MIGLCDGVCKKTIKLQWICLAGIDNKKSENSYYNSELKKHR